MTSQDHPTYSLVWVMLEQWHGMQECPDPMKTRLSIVSLIAEPFPNQHALKACRDFRDACKEHGIAFDLDYDID